MGAFSDALFAGLNATIGKAFGRITPVTYTPAVGSPISLTFTLGQPNLQEGTPNPQHVYAFANVPDFGSIVPASGDAVLLDGTAYRVYQVTNDQGLGVNLLLHRI